MSSPLPMGTTNRKYQVNSQLLGIFHASGPTTQLPS